MSTNQIVALILMFGAFSVGIGFGILLANAIAKRRIAGMRSLIRRKDQTYVALWERHQATYSALCDIAFKRLPGVPTDAVASSDELVSAMVARAWDGVEASRRTGRIGPK